MARKRFIWHPTFDSQIEVKPSITKLAFGDGYEHRQAEGLNWRRRNYSLTFQGAEAEMQEIDAFLWERGGVESFDWVTPDRKTLIVVCDSWNYRRSEGAITTLTATFRQVFE